MPSVHRKFINGELVEFTIDGVTQPLGGRSVLKNATGAAFRVAMATIKGEKVKASASEIERRMDICRDCQHFQESPMKCRKCGCYLNLKTRLETEHCPIQKW
jgi:hypothetical protein